jgi:tetratricopeptide (TPR) repeat protein
VTQVATPIDSLEAQLARSMSDTAKAGLLGYLCFHYAFVSPQKGLSYGQQGLHLSQQLEYKRGIAYCNQSLSFCLWVMGNFNEALQAALRSLYQYEELKDYPRIGYSYLALANIYRETGDYKKGLQEANKAMRIYDSIQFPQKVAYAVTGSIYERAGQLDSALKYIQKAYELDIILNSGKWGWLVHVLGNIHAKIKNYDVALAYYKIALSLTLRSKEPKDIVDIYNSIAALYKETGKKDSAIFYANAIVQRWRGTAYQQGLLQAANTLAEVYQTINQRDSVIKYLQLSVALNKELFTLEKEREFQNLTFNEQLRRKEKEQTAILLNKERKRNLQLLGIAAFIIILIVGVIVLSRKRTLLKSALYLGLLSVLLIFEFINLLAHPWIESVTHHNPILTLLILVMLASILIPAHHYLEALVKKKLVRKRKVKQTKVAGVNSEVTKTKAQ